MRSCGTPTPTPSLKPETLLTEDKEQADTLVLDDDSMLLKGRQTRHIVSRELVAEVNWTSQERGCV